MLNLLDVHYCVVRFCDEVTDGHIQPYTIDHAWHEVITYYVLLIMIEFRILLLVRHSPHELHLATYRGILAL